MINHYYVYEKVGNRGFLNGEHGWELVKQKQGIIYLDGDFTDEELDEGCDMQEVKTYVFFRDADGMYNTKVYIGDMYMYDFPDISEYHHKSEDEIDISDYEIGGCYEETEEMALAA